MPDLWKRFWNQTLSDSWTDLLRCLFFLQATWMPKFVDHGMGNSAAGDTIRRSGKRNRLYPSSRFVSCVHHFFIENSENLKTEHKDLVVLCKARMQKFGLGTMKQTQSQALMADKPLERKRFFWGWGLMGPIFLRASWFPEKTWVFRNETEKRPAGISVLWDLLLKMTYWV